MKHTFTIDGVPSSEYGIYIFGSDSEFKSAERLYDRVSVAGRDGDLIYDNGKYENVTFGYSCVIESDARAKLSGFRAFLMSKHGYVRVEDSIHPDEYYMAFLDGNVDPTLTNDFDKAKFTLNFIRMPQRFLKSGENEVTVTNSIYNPTNFEAKPLIRVMGTGTLTVNGTVMTITGNQQYMDIDCELGDAYMGSLNLNSNLTVQGWEFPKLSSGHNVISRSSGITSVVITPRWWTI